MTPRLHIEPVVPQPVKLPDDKWRWSIDGYTCTGSADFLSRRMPKYAPHRPGDELVRRRYKATGDALDGPDYDVMRGVVERVEARQAKDITQEEWVLANRRYDKAYQWGHHAWCWLMWLRED